MRLSAMSCLVVIAALFSGHGPAKAETDLSLQVGTFWRLDRLDHAPDVVSERTSIAAVVRREMFNSIVVHIVPTAIGFYAPGDVYRGYGAGPGSMAPRPPSWRLDLGAPFHPADPGLQMVLSWTPSRLGCRVSQATP